MVIYALRTPLTYLIRIRGGRPVDGYKMQQQRKSAICLVRSCQRDIGVITLDILDSISWSDLLDLHSAAVGEVSKEIGIMIGTLVASLEEVGKLNEAKAKNLSTQAQPSLRLEI